MYNTNMREEVYHFLPDNDRRWPFGIVSMGRSYCDGTYSMRRSISEITVIEYVVEGTGIVNIDRETLHPSAGDIYVLPKGSSHDYYADKKDPWIKVWFNVQGNLVPSLLSQYKLERVHMIRAWNLRKLFDAGLDLAQKGELSTSSLQKELSLIVHEIIMGIASLHYANTRYSDKVTKIMDYLDEHIERKMNVKLLGDLVGNSNTHVIRLFKKETGLTPYDFFLRRKIEYAKILLADTNASIADIAARLHFTDEFHFSRIFKQIAVKSPSQFRKES